MTDRKDRLAEQHDAWAESLGLPSFDRLMGQSEGQTFETRKAAAQEELEAALHRGDLPPLTHGRKRIDRDAGASLLDQISEFQNPDGDGRAISFAEERRLREEYGPLVDRFAAGEALDPSDPAARHGMELGAPAQRPSQVTQLPPKPEQMAETLNAEFEAAYGRQDPARLARVADQIVTEFGLDAKTLWENRTAVYAEAAKRLGVKEGGAKASAAHEHDFSDGRTELGASSAAARGPRRAADDDEGEPMFDALTRAQRTQGIY
jgi:hypothetical protein